MTVLQVTPWGDSAHASGDHRHPLGTQVSDCAAPLIEFVLTAITRHGSVLPRSITTSRSTSVCIGHFFGACMIAMFSLAAVHRSPTERPAGDTLMTQRSRWESIHSTPSKKAS